MTLQEPTIVVTRPIGAAEDFVTRLRADGIDLRTLVSPVVGIEPTAWEMPGDPAGAIFTSANGVRSVEGRDLPCWCVGDATMHAARARGWRAVSAEGDAEALLRRIRADAPDGPLVHFRGKHARGNLAQRLTDSGIETHEVVVYAQVAVDLDKAAHAALMGTNPVILPLFSPKSAEFLLAQGPFVAPLHVVAISSTVAEKALPLGGVDMIIADAPDVGAMVAAIRQVVNATCFIETGNNSA